MDVVSFSGDKLLGGTQAGIILGKKEYVERIKKNPMNRALRIDKLTLSALEATFRIYMEGEEAAIAKIPVLSMLAEPLERLRERAERVVDELKDLDGYSFEVLRDLSTVGGGALPAAEIYTYCVAIAGKQRCEEIEEMLRRRPKVPVVGRIKNDRVLLDMRTVREQEVGLLIESVKEALS